MIIGIDARFALGKRRGIGNYTLNLIDLLAQIDKKNQYILYTDTPDLDKVLPNTNNFNTIVVTPVNYLVWEQISLPKQIIKDGINVLHCTGNTAPALISGNIKLIMTIHDLMYLKNNTLLPESNIFYQKLGRIYRSFFVKKTIKNASKIITVSNFSKRDILYHFPTISENNIITTYEAANAIFRILDYEYARQILKNRFDLTSKYLLTLGGTDPRKNTKLVIQAFVKLKNEYKIDEKLVIVGIPHWEQTEYYNLVRSLKHEQEIIFTDFVAQEELVCLYNCATMFLYPSLYEGFGIPPLEAMACGTPVITSNTTSIPEIVGKAALKINPTNQNELEAAIYKLLIESSLRNNFTQLGLARVKDFSWLKMAEKTLDTYNCLFTDI